MSCVRDVQWECERWTGVDPRLRTLLPLVDADVLGAITLTSVIGPRRLRAQPPIKDLEALAVHDPSPVSFMRYVPSASRYALASSWTTVMPLRSATMCSPRPAARSTAAQAATCGVRHVSLANTCYVSFGVVRLRRRKAKAPRALQPTLVIWVRTVEFAPLFHAVRVSVRSAVRASVRCLASIDERRLRQRRHTAHHIQLLEAFERQASRRYGLPHLLRWAQ
eukprot:2388550-Prymnesium_polylepis.1